MMESEKPQFPITIRTHDGDVDVCGSPLQLITTLEFFDSEDPEEEANVTDALGRRVVLKIWKLEITEFRLG